MGKLVGFPEEGELVVGSVVKVEIFGAFVKLVRRASSMWPRLLPAG